MLSKTDYILFRECPKNVWLKIHRPDVYFKTELSDFEKTIIETGNEVEAVARKLFPEGVLIEGRDDAAKELTKKYIEEKIPTLFQPVFFKDGYLAAVDILHFESDSRGYSVYEVKASNDIDDKVHLHDLAFQINLLKLCGVKIWRAYIVHLNSEYVREGDLNIEKLFKVADVSKEIWEMADEVSAEMKVAKEYVLETKEPFGSCSCIYKGRSRHCSTFSYSNPNIPEYGVHDIVRIGLSKKKLKELIDNNIFHLHEVPSDLELSENQRNQINAHQFESVLINKEKIREEFEKLAFPLYFLDYETFPCAIPRFDGFSPYEHLLFQYSVHVLPMRGESLKHYSFLYADSGDPSEPIAKSLGSHIGTKGSVIVWNKGFECGRNIELSRRVPKMREFLEGINSRVYDLEDIFKKQYHVHKDFKGRTSIKKILPVLVPEISYQDLEIQEGGSAADTWNKLLGGVFTGEEKEKIINDLKAYCELDTYAMYAIWRELNKLIS